jgi:uncharacterized FlgJ-related protein
MKNIFKINPDTLELQSFSVFGKIITIVTAVSIILGSASLYIGYNLGRNTLISLTDEEKLIIIQEHNKFNEDKLIDKLKELNVNFPYIALAQAKLETGNYTSKIFRESNNLFGMKEAKSRITTAKGTQFNHAYYESWTESVYDFAFHQCRYLPNIKTEEQYFQYLGQNYAEDPNYINRLKDIINKENIKSKFGLSK